MILNLKRFSTFFATCLLVLSVMNAKITGTTVYMFGFSASFTDSLAYITDIQQLDSAYIDTKTGFLVDRAVYSDQLQTFIEAMKGVEQPTCAVFFHTKKAKLVKEFTKIKSKYATDDSLILMSVAGEGFRFQSPRYVPQTEEVAEKKSRKEKKENK